MAFDPYKKPPRVEAFHVPAGLRVDCPNCGKMHVFQSKGSAMELGKDEPFEPVKLGDRQRLWPDWVCENRDCLQIGVVVFDSAESEQT